jgi:hypothetical protein
MTTVVVVKKAGNVAIASDSLVTFGDTRLGPRFEATSPPLAQSRIFLRCASRSNLCPKKI